jgi:molybdopterin molybdotransferase
MTGAKMPIGANCVVPFEDALFSDDSVAKLPKLKNGDNFRKQAEELKKGDVLLNQGCLLDGVNISLLASNGKAFVDVYDKTRIAIISSGEEIIEPWEDAGSFATYNSNSVAIKSILKDSGFNADYKGVLPDNLEKMIKFIANLKSYDFIISTGGVSMGEADFMKQAYEKNNMKTIFHKINLKPGKPMLFGKMDNSYVFALPGNPMSCILGTLHFILPALRKSGGYTDCFIAPIKIKNKSDFKVSKYKANIVLGKIENNEFQAIKNNKYNSGMISPIRDANAMAIFHSDIDNVNKDEIINAVFLNSFNFTQNIQYMNK